VGAEPAAPYRQAISREVAVLVPDAAVPDPVTGLNSGFTATMSVSAFSAIDLDWSSYNEVAQHDVMRYRIYAGPSFYTDVTGMSPIEYVPAGPLRHTVGGLHGWSIYYMAVVAEDALGQWNPTVRSVSAQASIGALGEVQNLAVTSFTNSITLTWTAPAQVDAFLARYNLYFNGGTNPVAVNKAATSYSATGLQPAAGYTFRIATVDTFGTESAGVVVQAATLLDNPSDVAAQSFDGMIRLTWSHVEPNDLVKYYAVYQAGTNFTGVASMTPVLTTRGTRADVSGLANGTPYFFAATTVNIVDGQKQGVQAVTATPSPVSGQFADLATTNVTGPASAYSGQKITVNWSVTNTGTGSTCTRLGSPVSSWSDRVVLSPDTVYGNANDVLLTNVTHTGALNAGGGYAGTATVQLPTNLLGNFFVFVIANAAGQVYEYLDYGTNLGVAAATCHWSARDAVHHATALGSNGVPGIPGFVQRGRGRLASAHLPVATRLSNIAHGDKCDPPVAERSGFRCGQLCRSGCQPRWRDQQPSGYSHRQPAPAGFACAGSPCPNESLGGTARAHFMAGDQRRPFNRHLALAGDAPVGRQPRRRQRHDAVHHDQQHVTGCGQRRHADADSNPARRLVGHLLAGRAGGQRQSGRRGLRRDEQHLRCCTTHPHPVTRSAGQHSDFASLGAVRANCQRHLGGAQQRLHQCDRQLERPALPFAQLDLLVEHQASAYDAGPFHTGGGASYTNSQTVTLPLSSDLPPGNYFIVAVADSDQTQSETDYSNNSRSAPLTLTLPPLPDLSITNLNAPAVAHLGDPVVVT
jgi:hypothetical protein